MNWVQKACALAHDEQVEINNDAIYNEVHKIRYDSSFYVNMKAGHGNYGIVKDPCPVHLENFDDQTDAPPLRYGHNKRLSFNEGYSKFWRKRGYNEHIRS